MSLSNYPPGVSGNEPQIAGEDEFEFCCPSCTEELTFWGDRDHATADCPNCGEVTVSPADLLQSAYDEMRIDEIRDERFA